MKLILKVISLTLLSGCASFRYSPTKSGEENLKGIVAAYEADGTDGAWKYFSENAYKEPGNKVTVLNFTKREMNWQQIQDQIESDQKKIKNLLSCEKVEDSRSLQSCIDNNAPVFARQDEIAILNKLGVKVSELKNSEQQATDIKDQEWQKKLAVMDADSKEKRERYAKACKKHGYEFVVNATPSILNRFEGKDFYARVHGLGPYAQWLCFNKEKSKSLKYLRCGDGASCAVIKGVNQDIQFKHCANKYMVYQGSVPSRDENGFDGQAPVYKIIPNDILVKDFGIDPKTLRDFAQCNYF